MARAELTARYRDYTSGVLYPCRRPNSTLPTFFYLFPAPRDYAFSFPPSKTDDRSLFSLILRRQFDSEPSPGSGSAFGFRDSYQFTRGWKDVAKNGISIVC